MSTSSKRIMTISCACGSVELEAMGTPILCVVCYCDDCQEGARQIEALPDAPAVLDPDGGTSLLVYRKDRVFCSNGIARLQSHKIREKSVTNRMVAVCCNSAMILNFDDEKHWVDVYRSRCRGDVPSVQMGICAKFKPERDAARGELRSYPGYPLKFLMRLVAAKFTMLLAR